MAQNQTLKENSPILIELDRETAIKLLSATTIIGVTPRLKDYREAAQQTAAAIIKQLS